MRRKHTPVSGGVHHVMSKSIAGFNIFNSDQDYLRIKHALSYFSVVGSLPKLPHFLNLKSVQQKGFEPYFAEFAQNRSRHIQLIAYCLMPTHFHLVVKQLKNNGISTYLGNLLNSYARYFNTKHKRKGPLWESRFKNVPVKSDEQLIHLTRYVHLNPVTARIVEQPQEWKYSSYKEYLTTTPDKQNMCFYSNLIEIDPNKYREFVEDQIAYQRELSTIKKLILE